MSNEDTKSYTVHGVTITPLAGGFYELNHPSLDDPERVRGKEKADARAEEIAAAGGLGGDKMEAQPPLDQVLPVAPDDAEKDSKIDALTALAQKQSEQIQQLLAMVPTGVEVTEGNTANPLAGMPREFRGQATKEQKRLAKAKGVEYITIILEDVPEIPPTGLYLGHNGDGYMIMPGEPVDVPDFLLEVLNHAVLSMPIIDSKTQKVLGYRDRMRYPYHRVT